MTELPPPDASSVARRSSGVPPWPNPSFARPVLLERPPPPTLPIAAAVGAMVVLTASLIVSKLLLEALVQFEWPLIVYVVLTGVVGYGPSVVWCFHTSRRWGTGRLSDDIGLAPQWSDLGWGPVIWLAALGAQMAMAALVVGLDLPISNNTDGVTELQADRTYIVSLVVTAVIAAPVVEEMVFRGVVLRGARSRLPAILAIVVQGVLFGAAHIDPVRGSGNLGLVMVLAGVGIAFGAAAVWLRRIGPTIVAHAIFNGAVLVIVLTGVADRLQEAVLLG
jgi:membrane protease YdiL (CAAX protease family)